ncbi:hypothetical protein GF345_02060 [Candidatus Woesearchaeota archaeon]|nr:hypothetical protein [Candidatus Woesearchaeota archaeon]
MAEISNKTLAVLLVLTLVVSLGGTMISLSRLSSITSITGLATETANVSVYVDTEAAINFTTNATNFGSGYVHPDCTFCNMYTKTNQHANFTDTDCCVGTPGLHDPATPLVLENSGNVNVSVTFDFSDNATDGDNGGLLGGTDPLFQIYVYESEEYACVNATGLPGTGINSTWNNTFATVPTGDELVCNIFQPEQDQDELNISINITVPEDSKKGSLYSILTATATEV